MRKNKRMRKIIKNILCIVALVFLLKAVAFNPNWITTADPYIIGFNVVSISVDIVILVFLLIS